jgi:16S rRNA (uracil1498-N3)-methyltransferase
MPTIHRFFVEEPLAGGEGASVTLPRAVAHQMEVVLRLRPGDPVVLFDGRGGEWQAEVLSLRRGEGMARQLRYEPGCPEAPLRLTLCPALIKADRFEWVLQKGTELGATAFLPLLTRRVVGASGRGSPAERARERLLKTERWRRIVIEAAEQCGRTVVPEIHEPRALRTVLAGGLPSVFCWEGGDGAAPFRESLAHALEGAGIRGAAAGEAQILIGPEGGFTPDEAAAAVEAGAVPATLGPRILRSETAAIAAAALALLP